MSKEEMIRLMPYCPLLNIHSDSGVRCIKDGCAWWCADAYHVGACALAVIGDHFVKSGGDPDEEA